MEKKDPEGKRKRQGPRGEKKEKERTKGKRKIPSE